MTNFIRFLLIGTLSVLFSLNIFAQEKLKLDLNKAIELALIHSENVKIKELGVDRLEDQYDEALSYALPKINAEVSWNRYFKSPVITIFP